jgi:hypothetical protein
MREDALDYQLVDMFEVFTVTAPRLERLREMITLHQQNVIQTERQQLASLCARHEILVTLPVLESSSIPDSFY